MTSKEEMLELLKDFAEACEMANRGRTKVFLRDFEGRDVAWRYEDERYWHWLIERSKTIYGNSDGPICGYW